MNSQVLIFTHAGADFIGNTWTQRWQTITVDTVDMKNLWAKTTLWELWEWTKNSKVAKQQVKTHYKAFCFRILIWDIVIRKILKCCQGWKKDRFHVFSLLLLTYKINKWLEQAEGGQDHLANKFIQGNSTQVRDVKGSCKQLSPS